MQYQINSKEQYMKSNVFYANALFVADAAVLEINCLLTLALIICDWEKLHI
jgi:hypothetical protein